MHSVMEGPDLQEKGTGCPGLREESDVQGKGPDVRAGLGLPDAFGDGGAGFPSEGGRMSGASGGAGCLG